MKIGKDSVVSIDYKLHLGDGKVVDESEADAPLVYLHGYEEIVPGLEKALEGKSPGDSLKVTLSPDEGYGEYDPEDVEEVPRAQLPESDEVKVGDMMSGTDPDGDEVDCFVKEVRKDSVLLDFNHPFAGKTLHFEATVKEVRAATPDELEHGHAHGPDGHGHDHDHGHDHGHEH